MKLKTKVLLRDGSGINAGVVIGAVNRVVKGGKEESVLRIALGIADNLVVERPETEVVAQNYGTWEAYEIKRFVMEHFDERLDAIEKAFSEEVAPINETAPIRIEPIPVERAPVPQPSAAVPVLVIPARPNIVDEDVHFNGGDIRHKQRKKGYHTCRTKNWTRPSGSRKNRSRSSSRRSAT